MNERRDRLRPEPQGDDLHAAQRRRARRLGLVLGLVVIAIVVAAFAFRLSYMDAQR